MAFAPFISFLLLLFSGSLSVVVINKENELLTTVQDATLPSHPINKATHDLSQAQIDSLLSQRCFGLPFVPLKHESVECSKPDVSGSVTCTMACDKTHTLSGSADFGCSVTGGWDAWPTCNVVSDYGVGMPPLRLDYPMYMPTAFSVWGTQYGDLTCNFTIHATMNNAPTDPEVIELRAVMDLTSNQIVVDFAIHRLVCTRGGGSSVHEPRFGPYMILRVSNEGAYTHAMFAKKLDGAVKYSWGSSLTSSWSFVSDISAHPGNYWTHPYFETGCDRVEILFALPAIILGEYRPSDPSAHYLAPVAATMSLD